MRLRVDVPHDWLWVGRSSEDFDTVLAQSGSLASPGFVAEHEEGFSSVGPDMPLLGRGLDQVGGCGVVVLQPTDLTLDAAAADTPDDASLVVAETFEFLLAEE